MNKSVLIAIVVVIVIAVGGYFVMNSSHSSSASQQADTQQPTGAQPVAQQPMTGTMKDLMSKGSVQCKVTNSTANSQSSGTVYVGNGKMSGQFTATAAGKTITSNMVSDGTYIYTWSDAMPQGVKMEIAKAQNSQGTTDHPNMYTSQVSYTCDPWTVDDSKFSVPSTIKFMDVSAMMPGASASGSASAGGSSAAPMPGANCAACDAAPASARAACRAAMHCK